MLDLARIRAITLDLDDTLWPVWPTIHRAEAVLHSWLEAHAPAAAVLSAQPEIKKAIRADINARHADRAHDLSFLRREAIRAWMDFYVYPNAKAGQQIEITYSKTPTKATASGDTLAVADI